MVATLLSIFLPGGWSSCLPFYNWEKLDEKSCHAVVGSFEREETRKQAGTRARKKKEKENSN